MHRLTSRLAIALLTFTVGVTAVSIWLLQRNRKPSHEESVSLTNNHPSQGNEISHEAGNLKAILSDFIFVGSDTYVPHSIPSHGMDAKPMPTRFDVGQQYVFHSHNSDNDYHFEELQKRIRSQGFEILDAQKSAYRNVGGLLFSIRFRQANHRFIIFNEPDRQILGNVEMHKNWSVDDYVLAIEGNDN